MSRARQAITQLEPAPEGLANLEAEADLLGALLIENGLAEPVRQILTAADFFEPLHSRIYEAIQSRSLAGEAVTIALLAPHFRADPAIEDVGGLKYLARLTEGGQGLLAPRELATQIRDLARRRQARDALKGALQDIADLEVDPGNTIEAAKVALAIAPTGKILPLIDLTAWADREPPAREWALKDWIPARQATYLTGPGSAGKSLLAQQLCTCIALGLPFLGVPTSRAPALYLTCEDEPDELERRQKAICEALTVDRASLAGKLHLCSLAGALGNELVQFDASGKLIVTEAYRTLESTARTIGAGFVALDNVAHLFGGNENERSEVAGFVNLLNRLAQAINGATLFLGHPNKAGGPFSGSTAWENQVRSRIYLETPADDDGTVPDPDARLLSRQKSNYARNGERLAFRWHRWGYVLEDDLPPDTLAELAEATKAAAENDAFLRCLTTATKQRRAVSHNPSANYAPKIFAAMPEGKKYTAKAFAAAMERLLHLGQIEVDAQLWQGSNRHWKQGIRAVENPAEICAKHPCVEGAPNRAKLSENTAPNTLPIDYVYTGAASQAAAPYDDGSGRDRAEHERSPQ